MRTLLAIAIVLAATSALPVDADARRSAYRPRPPAYAVPPPRYYQPRYSYGPGYSYGPPRRYFGGESDCERRARAEDPSGIYAGYPCWARSTFGRTPGGGR